MSWHNRIALKRHGFRKMGGYQQPDDDMPLVKASSSLTASTASSRSISPRSGNTPSQIMCGSGLGFKVKGLNKNAKNNYNHSTKNIAAVPDEIEALSFPDLRASDNNSPVSILEENSHSFTVQFDPDNGVIPVVEEKSDSATVFFDEASNDGSIFTDSKQDKCDDEEDNRSLKPPSLADLNSYNSEEKERDASDSSSRNYLHEDADAATWKADEVDTFLDAEDFGDSSGRSPMLEISGINLVTERDRYVNELQETNHLMVFNALVLIQKQRDWIAGSLVTAKGASKGASNLIMMELSNLERKIKLLMDHKEWPNELERKKQKIDPLTPSKAFFKAMALIDRSIEQFHKGYLECMSNTGEENHELRARVEELLALNNTLQKEASRSKQKTETIRNLQKERDELTRRMDRTDEKLASLLPNDESESSTPKSKFLSVKSYIERLEAERERHFAEIRQLKDTMESTPVDSFTKGDDTQEENARASERSTLSALDKLADETISIDEVLSVVSDISDSENRLNDETDVLRDDLGSKWHTLQENEDAMALVASKENEVNKLSKAVSDQGCSIESLRSECKLMRVQLLELETNRNEYKYQCEVKDAALAISQDRISTLEEQVLGAHAQCAMYEEDLEAMKESFSPEIAATKQEFFHSGDEVKSQLERIQTQFEEELESKEKELKEVEEDRERLVRDLKSSMKEVEVERDNLRAELIRKNNASPRLPPLPPPIADTFKDEKKEADEDVLLPGHIDFERMQSRFAEKASKQANTIALLTEQNEIKDEQVKALQEMIESMLGNNKSEFRPEDKNRWGQRFSNLRAKSQRFSNLRAKSQRRASDLLNRSRHGGSTHGSRHGGSFHGSRHGGSIHSDADEMEDYSNR